MPADAEPMLVLADEALPLDDVLEAEVDLTELPDVPEVPELVEASVVEVVDGATLVVDLDGSEVTVNLTGVTAPADDECFADESAGQLEELAGDSVLLELGGDATGDEVPAYVWVEREGIRQLVNHALIAEGYATARFADEFENELFRAWFEADSALAEQNGLGLWAECTGPHGDEKPEPTNTPVPWTPTPTLDEIRAEYTPLADVCELAIRPGGMTGEQISFSGEIFTIQVAPAGNFYQVGDNRPIPVSAIIQIWVTAPDGSQEAVFVGYDGDTSGMFEGTWVTVYGTVEGTQSGTNVVGGAITQPLVIADLIEIG